MGSRSICWFRTSSGRRIIQTERSPTGCLWTKKHRQGTGYTTTPLHRPKLRPGNYSHPRIYGNTAWNGNNNEEATYVDTAGNATTPIYLNYKMSYLEANFIFKVNLNRLVSATASDNWDLYVFAAYLASCITPK